VVSTPFSEVYDLFLVSIEDYKLDDLYATIPDDFETVLKGFLIKAIPRFKNCVKDLEDRNDTTQTFNVSLSTTEKVILSNIMIYEWFQKEINDIRQFRLKMNNTDFKHFSEERNLSGKSKRSYEIREIFTQDMTEYGLDNIDWDAWKEGNYD